MANLTISATYDFGEEIWIATHCAECESELPPDGAKCPVCYCTECGRKKSHWDHSFNMQGCGRILKQPLTEPCERCQDEKERQA